MERIGNFNAAHLYQLTVCDRNIADWSNRKTIEVMANTRTQACSIAKKAGYYVGDCNMVG